MRLRSTRAHIERRKSPCYKKSMNKKDELKSLLDDELLVRLSNVLQDSRRVESVLVAHIAELVPHLTDANCDELLARATHKSKREILVLLPRSRQSRMSRPPSGRFRSDETTTSSKRRKSAVRTLQGRPVRRAAKPLRPDRVVRTLQPTLLPRRLTNGRRSSRCRRRSANNIRLACAAHNAYMAEMDYGKQKMDQYRRSADRVREPEPSFQLCPDIVHQSSSSAA